MFSLNLSPHEMEILEQHLLDWIYASNSNEHDEDEHHTLFDVLTKIEEFSEDRSHA